MSSPSPYAPRPAASQVHRTTRAPAGLLPVGGRAMPHLRAPCLLVASPEKAWWDPGIRDFAPVLDQLPLRAGANGVGEGRGGTLDCTQYQRDLEARGFRVLVNGDPALEVVRPEGKFLVTYPCVRGLSATVPFWEHPHVPARDREVRWIEDAEQRRAFVAGLLEHGLIEPITEDAKRAVYDQALGAHTKLCTEQAQRGKRGSESAELALTIARLEVRLGHMEARLAGEDPFLLEAEPEVSARRGKARRVDAPEPAPSPGSTPTVEPVPGTTSAPLGYVSLEQAQAMAARAAEEAVAKALAALRATPAASTPASTPKPRPIATRRGNGQP